MIPANRSNTSAPVVSDPMLKMVQRVARLMDEQFSIGGFKFGLDPLLNLIRWPATLAAILYR
ncbi:DUF4112 domain-containing protein [Niabella sp. W65]|nr:DUF4112 domain-containing protein [Niabella sp. W65]MCH7367096.1 DUF4112 domain-containing protein [Niabella sp. W65]